MNNAMNELEARLLDTIFADDEVEDIADILWVLRSCYAYLMSGTCQSCRAHHAAFLADQVPAMLALADHTAAARAEAEPEPQPRCH